jgi:ABC-type transport system substrate-binding protein
VPAASQPAPVDGGTLRYALSYDPVSVTPLFGGDESGLVVERNVFAGLVDTDPATLRIVPSIARSWSASPDGRTFTFDLRPGVRFQDGEGAVTADTFARDWALLCSPDTNSPNAAVLSAVAGYAACRSGAGTLSGVKRSGPLKLFVSLSRPFRDFVTVLADPATWAFPPDRVSSAAGRAAFEQHPVGAGPFQVESLVHREVVPGKATVQGEVVLGRYAGYFGNRPHLDRIDMPVVDAANPAASFTRYRSHGLDVLEVAESLVDVVRADPTFSRQLVGYPRLQLIALVAADPRSSSVDQRAALESSFDPADVVTDVFGKSGQTANGLVPVGTPGFVPGLLPPKPAGGSSAPGPVTISRPSEPVLQAIADSLVRSLQKSGVEVSITDHGAYELRVLNAGYPSPDALLAPISTLTDAAAGAISAARSAADPVRRDALYADAERDLLARRIVMPIAFGETQLLIAPRVRALSYDALGAPHLAAAWISQP